MTFPWIPSDDRVLALEDVVHDVFTIHDVQIRASGKVVVFVGQFLRSPELVYEAVVEAFHQRGFIPLLRQENGRDVLIAYPAPAVGRPSRLWVHVLLFVLTVLSTLVAGTLQAPGDSAERVGSLLSFFRAHWTAGIPFTVALLGILGTHELGHYFVARRYGLDVSLPYFIPFPLFLIEPSSITIGTMGAVIRIQSPFESRKSLFDVGIAGPLAGLVVAIPVLALGMVNAQMAPVQPGPNVAIFNEPLLFQWMVLLIRGPRPPGMDIIMNPLLMAGWWGLFITALNLVPVSQLDGGHISYALLGSSHRYLAWGVFLAAVAMTILGLSFYVIMLFLVFMMGIEHPPALNDLTPIGRPRQILGVFTLFLFLTLITLSPFGNLR